MRLLELGYELPNNWREATISDVTSKVGSGATPRGGSSVYTNNGIPLVRSQNVLDNSFSNAGLAFLSDQSASSLKNVELRANDVLLNITGDSILRCCLLPDVMIGGRVNQHVAIIRASDAVIPLYLQKWLVQDWFKDFMLSHSAGATRKAITKGQILSFPIALPPLPEQRRIAGVLGALDDKIESNLRTISLSESLILAHFSSLFNSGHVSAGTALSDLMDVNPRYSLKRESLAIKVSMQDIPSDFPVINTHAVMPVGAGSRFSNGDVLFARISPCLENGKTAIVDFLSSSEVGFGSTEFIVLSPRGEISTTWIYALARDPNFRETCRQAMSGSSGRQRLSADFFTRYTIATPKESNLVAFNEATMPLLTFMGARRDENQRLAPLRDALLPELMSGRMRVDEAGQLVSEALDEEVC